MTDVMMLGGRDVRVVRTDEIEMASVLPSPHQPRKMYDPLVIKSLVESIDAVGVLQRPRVREAAGGYELIFGHQRAEACRQLGWDKLPVEVIECPDITARRMTLHENIKSTRLHPIEHAEAIVKFLDATLSLDDGYEAAVDGQTSAERVANVLERLTIVPDDPSMPDPTRAFVARKEELIRQILREMASKEPKGFLSADMSLLALPDQILNTTIEKGLKKGHARALGQLLAREPNMFDDVMARGIRVQSEDENVDDSWMPLEKAPASAIRNLYSPPKPKKDKGDYGDEPREMAADRRYMPVGIPGRAEAVPEATLADLGDDLPPWEDDAVTPIFGLPLASLGEAHSNLTTMSSQEWVAMILESTGSTGDDARRQWQAIGRLADEIRDALG